MLYVSDRWAGNVSVISFACRRIVATWTIRGGGSPDMGGVSAARQDAVADRPVRWASPFDTAAGRLVAKI